MRFYRPLIVVTVCIYLCGCVSLQSFSTASRAGDTITLAVGSAEGMTKNNTTLTYTPDSTGVPIDIPQSSIRAIVPLYPDKRTKAWSNSAATAIDSQTGHGAWLTVLVVDLPLSLSAYVGTGVINVHTTATFAGSSSKVNGEDIALEILPGNGEPASFSYKSYINAPAQDGVLSDVEVLPHYLIKPDLVDEPFWATPMWPTYGAITIKITGPISGTESEIRNEMRVVIDDMEQSFQSHSQMSWARDGDSITINIISPKGALNYFEARISIFSRTGNVYYPSLPLVDTKYYDIQGNEVPGPVINISYKSA